MTFVVDASVALTWIFRDEVHPEADRLLDQVMAQGAHAPALWRLEVANVLMAAWRRGRLSADALDGDVRSLLALPIRLDHDSTGPAFEDVRSLAARHRLTVYDATYLELARRLRHPLATLDKALRAAARAEGVHLLP